MNTKYYGVTALMHATHKGNEKCTEVLIKAGADVNLTSDEYGKTALHFAAERDEKCFEMLLKIGADVNIKTHSGNTILMSCVNHRNYERVKKVIEAGADVNTKNDCGQTVLNSCMCPWQYEYAKNIIEAGADVNVDTSNVYNRTSLFLAALSDSRETMCLLLRNGIKINILNARGVNALEWYLSRRDVLDEEVCMLLFAAGESVTKVTNELTINHLCLG